MGRLLPPTLTFAPSIVTPSTATNPGAVSPPDRLGKNCAVGAALSKRTVTVVFGDVRPSAVAYHQT